MGTHDIKSKETETKERPHHESVTHIKVIDELSDTLLVG